MGSYRLDDDLGSVRLSGGGWSEFGLQFGDVIVEGLEGLGPFHLGAHGDLQQFGSRETTIFDLAKQVVR